ncbi:MAG: GTPase domain-containing protein [Synergistaceae bacterium]|nr:GTPase domain-containing protein [Synergistaceae bacterium]MBR0247765.1 GTPase domain-containing protein [Synergistaceae bacterium]
MPDEVERIETANIVIAGMSGSGKTTLINTMFNLEGDAKGQTGKGSPQTQYAREYSSENVPVKILDTVGFELRDSKRDKTMQAIKQRILEGAADSDKAHFNLNGIHVIWYCIGIGQDRLFDEEVEFIKDLHSIGLPFIIVLTKCYFLEDVNEWTQIVNIALRSKGMEDIPIVPVLAQKKGNTEPFGLNKLVDVTVSNLPRFIKNGFIAAQKVNVASKKELATEILHRSVKDAMGFINKIPLVNIFTSQYDVYNAFEKIAKVYNLVLSDDDIEKIWAEVWGFSGKMEIAGRVAIPFADFGASQKLNKKIKDGEIESFEDVGIKEFGKLDQAASVLALFGHEFIEAATSVWQDMIDGELKKVEEFAEVLAKLIKEKWSKYSFGHYLHNYEK